MKIAELAITKRIVTLFIVVLLIGGGIIAFEKLGRLEDPEFTIKEALVVTPYPGATALQVEQEVTDPIEIAIQQLSQLKHIKNSISKEGLSIITVEIKDKYDKKTLPQVWDELRRKVNDAQSKLPPGAGPSIVNDDFGDVYGILFALTGKGYSYRELEKFADFLRKELLLVPDVAKVELYGVQPQQVYVEIPRERMAQLGISLEDIYHTLGRQNLVTPSGATRVGSEYIRIHPTGEFTSIKQIGDLLVKGSQPGKLIFLKDIAKIKRTYQTPPRSITRNNSNNAIVIGISIASGGNVVTMGDAVKKRLQELEQVTPLGMNIDIISFQSDSVTESIDNFIVSLLEAVVIVIAVLMIFMGLRSGLLIGFTLFLTVMGTFVGMYLWQINLERISLGALIIALGMLVDNAIVINEGMLIRIEAGMDRIKAAKEVVAQSAIPLFGATVIAVLAFAAIGLSQDSTGEYTRSLFQVILISLMLSWIIAITVTPLLCVMFIKPKPASEQTDPYRGALFVIYKKYLSFCLRFRWMTLAVLAALLASSIYCFGLLENSFFPDSTRPQLLVHYWLPEGTDIRTTSSDMKKLEKFIQKQPQVDSVATFVGQGAPRFILTYSPEKEYSSYGILIVNVKSYDDIPSLTPVIQQYADNTFPDAQTKIRKFVLGPGREDSIEVRFSGPDPDVLRNLSNQAKSIMIADGGAVGVKDDWRERIKVLRPIIAETQAREAGITRKEINDALQMNFTGYQVGIYREDDKLLPILSIAPQKERDDIADIKNIQIWSPVAQKTIPLTQVVEGFKTSWEDGVIMRRDRKRTITAKASQKSGNASTVLERIKPKIDAIPLPVGYERQWGGEYEDSTDAQAALFGNIPITIILMIAILVMLFNTIKQPLIIVFTVPLAVIGVAFGLLVMNQSFGFMALLGFLSLTGMLIKNSIVLIEQIDIENETGKEPMTAILDACVSRLRPVSMAAVTTVLGMIPLLFDVFFIGMAVTIMAGLTFATILTLIVVPVLYAIFYKIIYVDKS